MFSAAAGKVVATLEGMYCHHRDAERSVIAFHRCDLSPKRSIFCQLESIGHRYSRVPADLISPSGGRSALSTPLQQVWKICCAGTSSASLATWPLFADNRRPVRYRTLSLERWSLVIPSDVKDLSLTGRVERIQSPPVKPSKCPCFRAVEVYRYHTCRIYTNFRWQAEFRLISDTVEEFHYRGLRQQVQYVGIVSCKRQNSRPSARIQRNSLPTQRLWFILALWQWLAL